MSLWIKSQVIASMEAETLKTALKKVADDQIRPFFTDVVHHQEPANVKIADMEKKLEEFNKEVQAVAADIVQSIATYVAEAAKTAKGKMGTSRVATPSQEDVATKPPEAGV